MGAKAQPAGIGQETRRIAERGSITPQAARGEPQEKVRA
jgi:hypothetical protein